MIQRNTAATVNVGIAMPVQDRHGNRLVGLEVIAEVDLGETTAHIPLPLSLVVAIHAGSVLFIFNRWRKEWELPGGMIEDSESPRVAAQRELHEETGIATSALQFESRALFELQNPERREHAAVYSTLLATLPLLVANEEAVDFMWWAPGQFVEENMSVLDAAIATAIVSSQDGSLDKP